MSRHDILRKRSDQCDRAAEVFVATSPQIVLCFGLFSAGESKLSKVVVNLPQPARVGRLAGVLRAPVQLVLSCFLLVKKTGKLRIDDTGNPVHNEDLPSGKLPRLFQDRDGVFDVTDSEIGRTS